MARRPAKTGHDEPATHYACQVVEGSVPAGPHVRAACARHLRDLQEGSRRGLAWDIEAANRAIGFYSDVLVLNGGEHEGKPFHLLPWQAFVIGSVFGWKNGEGLRRFRVAFIESGKGSGKSPLAAGVGMYGLTADGESRAEIYAAASKKDQAAILFRDAVAMGRLSPRLAERLSFSGSPGKEWNIAHHKSSSFFRPIASEDGQSGPRPHMGILDEIHEHRDGTMVELMRAGTKGRRQALIFMITNSGAARAGVAWDYHVYGAKVAAGDIEDDAFFAYICALDPGDDPFKSEDCWAKANPSLGHTFSMRYLREQVTQARGMPSKEAIVRRLNFCEWTDALTPWIDRDMWERAEREDVDLAAVASWPCYLGLDLASKRDLTALAACWRNPSTGEMVLAVWFWTPGDTLEERARSDNAPYSVWRDAGHLNAPPGRIIDKGHVAVFVQEFARTNRIAALAYDQAQIEDFQRACDDIGLDTWVSTGEKDEAEGVGVKMLRHGQGYAGYASASALWMPRSVSDFEDAIIRGALRIKANPVLRWNSASAVLVADPQSNRKWDKRKSTGRIDGIVAACMAVGAACWRPAETARSIWDDEDKVEAVTEAKAPDGLFGERESDGGGAGGGSIWDRPGW